MPLRPLSPGLLLLLVVGCSDAGPAANAGTLRATVASPNGDEGAAVLILFGRGLGDVAPVGDTEVFRSDRDNLTRLVLVNRRGGDLSFEVEVPDVRLPPVTVVLEVAGPDDELRSGVASYRVEYAE